MANEFDRIWEWFQSQPEWVYIIYLAFAFSMFFVFFYYFEDRYEREPLRKVFKAFIIGILSVIPVFLLEIGIGQIIFLSPIIMTCVMAPIVEEACKGYGVFRFRKDPNFNGAIDGLVYGGVIGSGFAFIENILYGLSAYSEFDLTAGLELTAIRGMGLAVGHMLFTGYTGSEIGIRKIHGGGFWPKGYIVAVVLHGLWNFVSIIAAGLGVILGFGSLIGLTIVYFMIFRRRVHILREIDIQEHVTTIKKHPIQKKPIGIKIVALLVCIEGIFSMIGGLVYMGVISLSLFPIPSWITGYEVQIGVVWILIGVLITGVGTGLWRLKKIAWVITTLFTMIFLVFSALGLPATWLVFGFSAIILLYLISVRQYF